MMYGAVSSTDEPANTEENIMADEQQKENEDVPSMEADKEPIDSNGKAANESETPTDPAEVEITESPRPRCFPDKYMLPAKFSYFFVMAKDSCYQPYFILFLIGVGMSPREAAFINGIRLIGMMSGVIFWGHMSDKRQNHKHVILILTVVGMVLMVLNPLLAIAVGDKKRNICPYPMDTVGNEALKIEASFWVLLFLNIVASFFDGCTVSFVDAGVIQRINVSNQPKDFGFNRLFGVFGFSIGSLVSSLVIKNFPTGDTNCYTGIFILHVVFSLGLIVSSYFLFRGADMKIPHKERNLNVRNQVWKTFSQIDNLMFLVTLLVMGTMQGVFISFTSLQLKNLNAPTEALGLTTMIAAMSTGPATARSTKLIGLFKNTWNVTIFGCFTYFVRYIAFAYITNPWIALPISIFQFFGLGLFIIATIHHVKSISIPQIYTTMYGIANATHFGFGFILANVIYGQIYKFYGGKTMFIVAGSTAGVWTAVLVIYKAFRKVVATDVDGNQELELEPDEKLRIRGESMRFM